MFIRAKKQRINPNPFVSPPPSSATYSSMSTLQQGFLPILLASLRSVFHIKVRECELDCVVTAYNLQWLPRALQMKTKIFSVASHALGHMALSCLPYISHSQPFTASATLASPYFCRHSGSLHI